MKKLSYAVPLALIFLFLLLRLLNPSFIDGYVETLFVDLRFKLENAITEPRIPGDILIVAIDEKSLAEYGRWPWDRELQALLVKKVVDRNPKALAIDIFYPEAENPEADEALADVFREAGNRLVVALGFDVKKDQVFEGEVSDNLWDDAIMNIQNASQLNVPEAFRVLTPPEPIGSSALFGHVYYLPDRDGKLRWENLVIKYGSEYFPSLALQTARIAKGVAPENVIIRGSTGIDLNGTFIPTDEYSRLHIKYLGPENSFLQISAADVLTDRVPGDLFGGKIIIIGTSAIGTYDLKISPFSANMTGAEKNATVVANIMTGDFLRQSPLVLDLAMILGAGLAVLIICRKLNAAWSLLAFISILIFFLVGNQALFTWSGLRLNLVYPLATILANGTFLISYRYFIEEKSGRQIKRMFSNYVTERVVEELIRNPEVARLGGERREVTVLFSDIKGFTAFSEKTRPEEVVAILNEYLTAMCEVVFHWEGTLDKFMGDAIVAFWNAPIVQEDHAERALRCTLHMINRLEDLKRGWISRGLSTFDIGVGINTGEVIVGNIGAEGKKMDYTIIGDHVNIGARLEGLTRKYDTNILISGYTLGHIKGLLGGGRFGHVSVKGLEQVFVKGRETPVEVYEFKPLEDGQDTKVKIGREAIDSADVNLKST